MTGLLENSRPTACYFQWNSWKLRLPFFRSLGWTNPSRVRKCILQGYPWKKVEFWRNKTFFGPTFPFPWSPGLSSLAALSRQLSCRSRKVKSCPSESLVLTWIHSFRGKVRGIYIPSSQNFWSKEWFSSKIRCLNFLGLWVKTLWPL